MKTVYIYIGLLAICLSSSAQDSLRYYLEIAAKNNPTVLQKYTEYQAALQKVPQVGSLPDPELNVGVFLSSMELVEGKQVADIRLMQMIPWFGVLRAAKDEMSLMAKAKYELLRDAKLQLFYEVQRTWYELYRRNQNIRISETNLQILHSIERLTLVKFKTASAKGSKAPSSGEPANSSAEASANSKGMQTGQETTPSSETASQPMQKGGMGTATEGSGLVELYRIQMETAELENNIALLRNQQTTTVAKFNSFLNRPMQSPVVPPDTLGNDSLTVPLPALLDSMLSNHPMLGMLQYEQQSFEARKKMVTRMGYPMIGFGVNYSLISPLEMSTSPMNGKDMIMPMVVVTLPIYRKKYRAQQMEAGLQKTATAQNYTAAANDLQTDYYQSVQLFRDAERRKNLYSNQYILANKTLQLMLKSFSTSGNGLSDILRIRQQTLDYELKKIDAETDYYTSMAWLKRLMAFSQTK